jgi:deoxyribonuclease V
MDSEGASSESSSSGDQLEKWTEEQDELKKKLIAYDDFTWKLSSSTELSQGSEILKYVGGVDMSFCKEDSSVACACLVVLELPSLRVVHHDFSLLRLHVPYVPGFLAFREVSFSYYFVSPSNALLNSFASLKYLRSQNWIFHVTGSGSFADSAEDER